jgi:hypothetical protein
MAIIEIFLFYLFSGKNNFICESRVKISESLRTLRKPLRSLRLGKSLTKQNAKKRLYLSTFISNLDSHFIRYTGKN